MQSGTGLLLKAKVETMVNRINRFSVATAIGAVLLPLATPAAAANLPRPAAATAFETHDAQAGNVVEQRRGDRRWDRDRDRGWGRDRYRDRDRGIDAGTAIAGVLVLGSIAAILADSSNKRDRQQEQDYDPYPYPEDARYNDGRGSNANYDQDYSQAPAYPGGPVDGDYGYAPNNYDTPAADNQYDEATYARLRQQQNGSYNGY